jgi:uncharacterized protein YjbI with pentapeptide repeats
MAGAAHFSTAQRLPGRAGRAGDHVSIDRDGRNATRATALIEVARYLLDVGTDPLPFDDDAAAELAIARSLAQRGCIDGLRIEERSIHGLDLRGVSAQKVVFSKVDLGGSRLDGTDFSNARLDGSVLARATLNDAKFDGARAIDLDASETVCEGASFLRCNLRGARFEGAKLAGAKFEEASLEGVDLRRAHRVRVDLSKARLANAKLDGSRCSCELRCTRGS